MNLSQKLILVLFIIGTGLLACSGANKQNKVATTTTTETTAKPATAEKKVKIATANTKPKQKVSAEGVSVNFKSTNAKKGENTCMDVVVKQFTDVVSMQYSINWNPKELTYKSVQGFQLKDLSKNNFGHTKAKDGKLTFSWYDQAIKGISVADNTVIHQICFDAIGEKGTKSKVLITEEPIIVEITGKGGKFLKLFTETSYLKIK